MATEFADQRHAILRAVQSESKRDLDNAIEALGNLLHTDIARVFIPILEDIPIKEKLAEAEKRLGMDFHAKGTLQTVLLDLLDDPDPFVRGLCLFVMGEGTLAVLPGDRIGPYLTSENRIVAEAARWASGRIMSKTRDEGDAALGPDLIDRTLEMGKIPLFEGLPVHALLTIAASTAMRQFPEGELVIREGDPGDALYLVRTGLLGVIKGLGTGRERRITSLGPGDFVGEMALLSQQPRSASVQTESEAMLLTIGAKEFKEIFQEYPIIPIHICRELARRIQELHDQLKALEGGRKKGARS